MLLLAGGKPSFQLPAAAHALGRADYGRVLASETAAADAAQEALWTAGDREASVSGGSALLVFPVAGTGDYAGKWGVPLKASVKAYSCTWQTTGQTVVSDWT